MPRKTKKPFTVLIASICIAATITWVACIDQDHYVKYIPVEDFMMHVQITGHGSPTVIFESGMASPKEVWNHIPDSLSKDVRTIAYDRAGIGKSENTSRARTVPNMVEELRSMLKKEGIEPPFILVAHSMGSYLARYYATQYGEEVQAILLIDPSPDRLYDQYSVGEYEEFQEMGTESFGNSTIGERKEWESYLENRKYVQEGHLPSTIPIYIVSASQWDFDKHHLEMLNDHPLSKHFKVDAGHDVHKERPELIIKLVRDLLQQGILSDKL